MRSIEHLIVKTENVQMDNQDIEFYPAILGIINLIR